jgi:hypothetical protein
MVGRKWKIFCQFTIECYHGREDGNIVGYDVKNLVLHRFFYKIFKNEFNTISGNINLG